MTKLKPGDCVICRLKDKVIVNPYSSDYDELKTFDIIASDSLGYYLYIPPYTFLKGTVRVDFALLKTLAIDKKYLNDSILYIDSGLIYKVRHLMDGCACSVCKDFYYQAEPNQENGTMICWSCRNDPYR